MSQPYDHRTPWPTLFGQFTRYIGYFIAWGLYHGRLPFLRPNQPPEPSCKQSFGSITAALWKNSSKHLQRGLDKFVLPVFEIFAKWQLASLMVLWLLAAGFTIPFWGLHGLLLLGAGLSIALGYRKIYKANKKEQESKQLLKLKARVEDLENRLRCLEAGPDFTPLRRVEIPRNKTRHGEHSVAIQAVEVARVGKFFHKHA